MNSIEPPRFLMHSCISLAQCAWKLSIKIILLLRLARSSNFRLKYSKSSFIDDGNQIIAHFADGPVIELIELFSSLALGSTKIISTKFLDCQIFQRASLHFLDILQMQTIFPFSLPDGPPSSCRTGPTASVSPYLNERQYRRRAP